jgi:hypothetical protein
LTNRLEQYFYLRVDPSHRPPHYLSNNHDLSPSTSASDEEKTDRDVHSKKDAAETKAEAHPKESGKGKKNVYDGSLVKAINAAFFWRIWPPGIMYLISGRNLLTRCVYLHVEFETFASLIVYHNSINQQGTIDLA